MSDEHPDAFPEDWPLGEGQYRLPDGRIVQEVPEDHQGRVDFVCRKFDMRAHVSILKEELHPRLLPVVEVANQNVRRYVSAAATVREQVQEEYRAGKIEWDAMAQELEKRWHTIWEAIPYDSCEQALYDALGESRKDLARSMSDCISRELDHAADYALGIYYPRIPMMAELPTPLTKA